MGADRKSIRPEAQSLVACTVWAKAQNYLRNNDKINSKD